MDIQELCDKLEWFANRGFIRDLEIKYLPEDMLINARMVTSDGETHFALRTELKLVIEDLVDIVAEFAADAIDHDLDLVDHVLNTLLRKDQ